MKEIYVDDFNLKCDLRVEYTHGLSMDEEPSIMIEKVEMVFTNTTIVDGKRHVNDIALDITHFIQQEEQWEIVDHILEETL